MCRCRLSQSNEDRRPYPTPPWLVIRRTVRFGETDPAGVVHFHYLLHWRHEAYEESLARFGVAIYCNVLEKGSIR
ncbi:MAG: hypothetical protein TE42_05280 [Candidatus Synechococcus spongiarum SP3]|uniref:Thioesterase domain-containing protein n=1 Tax=Candidatus Synechococcus spongiarum SP3 TaxID=1604020 RepID=A0A0G2J4W1_9SYNE|nr:MAG: hypothetical protein TE42_05280 [Candidatus Synechococcus spongiarum SP3]